jgi:type I restriction enzyme S subunit
MKENQEVWNTSSFKDLFSFEKKSKHKASEGKEYGKYKFFTSSPIQRKFLDKFDFNGEYLVFGTGGNASAHYVNESFTVSTDCLVAFSQSNKVLARYAYYYLSGNIQLLEAGFRGAGLKHISRKYIDKLQIPYPSIEVQLQIVGSLEKAEKLKDLREGADELSKVLLKNVFLEMFGDPAINTKNFESVPLKKLYSTKKSGTKCGPFGSALKKNEYIKGGVPVWTMDNIEENEFSKDGCLYISYEKFNELKSYSVESGDILISRAGTVGKMCVVQTNEQYSIISTNLIRLSLDDSKILPIYFTSLMTYFGDRVVKLKTGEDGSYTFMNTTVLDTLRIPLPPIELQRRFLDVSTRLTRLRLSQKNSRELIENLFNSVIQKAMV